MARRGDELDNPVTGLRTVVRQSAAATGGELVQAEWIGAPGWTTGPDHVHPHQDERFEVLAGELRLRVDGVERVHGAGEAIVAPAGAAHAASNAGDEPVRVLVDFRPTLRTETAFETLAGLARDGKTNRLGAPKNPLRVGVVLNHSRDEIYFASPPLIVQRVVLGALAAAGRLLGYEPEYPYPYPEPSTAREADVEMAGWR